MKLEFNYLVKIAYNYASKLEGWEIYKIEFSKSEATITIRNDAGSSFEFNKIHAFYTQSCGYMRMQSRYLQVWRADKNHKRTRIKKSEWQLLIDEEWEV